jgi:hypothetical protein
MTSAKAMASSASVTGLLIMETISPISGTEQAFTLTALTKSTMASGRLD